MALVLVISNVSGMGITPNSCHVTHQFMSPSKSLALRATNTPPIIFFIESHQLLLEICGIATYPKIARVLLERQNSKRMLSMKFWKKKFNYGSSKDAFDDSKVNLKLWSLEQEFISNDFVNEKVLSRMEPQRQRRKVLVDKDHMATLLKPPIFEIPKMLS
ncbi:hypothetical protein QQP08_024869 [Theobroma cacao]|nr:hypothetical protein QQP08_024869 [Theobroma cacao]